MGWCKNPGVPSPWPEMTTWKGVGRGGWDCCALADGIAQECTTSANSNEEKTGGPGVLNSEVRVGSRLNMVLSVSNRGQEGAGGKRDGSYIGKEPLEGIDSCTSLGSAPPGKADRKEALL